MIPVGKARHAVACAFALCGACGDDVHRLAVHGMLGAPVPATRMANVLFTNVSVDGSSPAPLLVDTGAPLVVLAPSRFPSARLPSGAGSVVGSIDVGAVTFTDVPVLAFDLFGDRPGLSPAGLLGGDALLPVALTLDYQGATVRFGDGPPTSAATAMSPATRVSIAVEGGSGGGAVAGGAQLSYPATRVAVEVDLEGTTRRFIVDSGSSYVVVRDALWRSLASDGRPRLEGVPIFSTDGVLAARITRARRIAVAGESVSGAPLLDVGDSLLDGLAVEVGHPVDGLLGGTYLREFLTTVDYPGRALWLARYTSHVPFDPDEFHQVGVSLAIARAEAAAPFTVAVVYPGTDAATQHLVVGDALIAISGTSLAGLSLHDAEQLLHGPIATRKTIELARGSITVAVDDLLPDL